jgi:hypothetical protein
MGFFDKLFGNGKKKNFTASADLMPENQFWEIIETTFHNANTDYEEQQEELSKELWELSLQDIILFENRFRQLRGHAYNWQLWAAIYIIHGGCGEDSLKDFRDWVIAQGQDFYTRTVSDPESLVDMEQEKIDIDWEGIGYIPSTVFKQLSGQKIASAFQENQELRGNEWEEETDDLKNMFPKLWAKYAEGHDGFRDL